MRAQETWELNFDSAPFCNGSLHLGHVRNYTLGDVRARWLRRKGVNVVYTSAYDSFGIPNETGARRAGMPTIDFVAAHIRHIEEQFLALNLSYSRLPIPDYSNPAYYKWTQWLFLQLWRKGLIYRLDQPVAFCSSCDSMPPASQVVDDRCPLCDDPLEPGQNDQWYIKTRLYADRLHQGIRHLKDWSPRARRILRSYMGRMEGTRSEVEIPVDDGRFSVTLFTPGDVLHQNSALALRADHPLAKYLSGEQTGEAEEITRQKTRRTERTGVERKVRVRLRIEDHVSPVYLAPPGDFPVDIDMMRITAAVDDSAETACISGNEKDIRPSITYRIRDWAVSRNRVWGTPIPMVECENCGTSPVDMSELPIRAKAHSGGRTARCGSCHTSQPLVPLVLDCFFDDSWCFYGASLNQALKQAPGNSPEKTFENNPFTEWQRRPASRVHFHAGFDTFVYFHIFRFMGHVLFDLGYTPRPEPIDFFHGHDVVKIDGKKMSKRHGNAPDLDQLIRECGCDVIRLSVLTNSNPGKPMSWSEDRLQHGRAVVETLVDLIASENTSWNSPIDGQQTGANQKHLTDINAELTRVDELIGLYRIGAALDLLYKATRKMLRYRQTAEESAWRETYDEMISWWGIFAPETVESRTDSTKGARITRPREHPRRS